MERPLGAARATRLPLRGQARREIEMACIDVARPESAALDAASVIDIGRRGAARDGRMEVALRCVASGYMSDGCSCRCTIPVGVVISAWSRELEKEAGERFFHFAWHDGEWLAYGLEDGLVRGVYCPQHSAQRDERSFSYGSRADSAPNDLAVGS